MLYAGKFIYKCSVLVAIATVSDIERAICIGAATGCIHFHGHTAALAKTIKSSHDFFAGNVSAMLEICNDFCLLG